MHLNTKNIAIMKFNIHQCVDKTGYFLDSLITFCLKSNIVSLMRKPRMCKIKVLREFNSWGMNLDWKPHHLNCIENWNQFF